jgi:hypothetical protein
MMRWLTGFVATLILEGPIVAAGFSRDEPSIAKRLAAVLIANIATHPIAWALASASGWSPFVSGLVEIGAVLAEAAIYVRTLGPAPRGKAFAVSLTANGLSCLVVPLLMFVGSGPR